MADSRGNRVLIVEDEADSAEFLRMLLCHRNIGCFVACDAESARGVLEEHEVDLILIDLNLPGIDGWGLLRELRKNPATCTVPMVAVTAFHANTVAYEALAAGFDAYFSKPLEARQLIVELEALMA